MRSLKTFIRTVASAMPCNLKKKHFVALPDAVGERLLSHISNKGDDDFVIGIRIVRRNHPESDSGLVSD